MNRLLLANPRLVRSFGNLATEVEHVMDRILGDSPEGESVVGGGKNLAGFTPRLDAAETEKGYEISVDLPGVKAEDVQIEMHEDRLLITGKRQSVVETHGKQYHRVERSSGSFARSIVLPVPVDQDRIEASYADGVLHVSLPKLTMGQPRKIQIKSSSPQSEPAHREAVQSQGGCGNC